MPDPYFAAVVDEIDSLASTQTLHAMVLKQNRDGRRILELINRGLAELMTSGKWFEVVFTHQGAQLAAMD